MAFEAFLETDDRRPRRRRRLTYSISLAVHAALLAGGIAYSFWHVEEISPPTVRVTFMATAPPPPAAPPAPLAGGGDAPKKKAAATKIKPTLTNVVQPPVISPKKEEPKTDPEPDDEDASQAFAGGPKGKGPGRIDGDPGGNPAGKGPPGSDPAGPPGGAGVAHTLAPKMLPPQMGALQKLSGDDPDFPAMLRRRTGMLYVVLTKICASKTGTVDSVSILKGADSLLDNNVITAVKRWRYRPLMADNNAVPFCYFGRFEFKSN